jgi:hypothetical protein
MNKFPILWMLALILVSLNLWAQGGNEVGNGADIPKGQTTRAWFLQLNDGSNFSRRIRYCYNRSSDFGVPALVVESELRQAFLTWTDYARMKGVNALTRSFRIVTEGQLIPNCDGSEDLRFEMGTITDEIQAAKKYYNNPVAFAAQRSYSVDSGWGNGSIWISSAGMVDPERHYPNWKADGALQAILLHELGHVFGCSHIQGTILDEHLASLLRDGLWPKDQLRSIDYSREVLVQRQDVRCYKGELGLSHNPASAAAAFNVLMGREPQGAVRAVLVMSRGKGELRIFEEGQGAKTFSLYPTGVETDSDVEGSYAFGYLTRQNGQLLGIETLAAGKISSAQIYTGFGEVLNILIEDNVSNMGSQAHGDDVNGPLNIRYSFQKVTGDREVGKLFTSFPLSISSTSCQ